MFSWIAEKSTNMNFLKQPGNLEDEDDMEILEKPLVREIVPMAPPNKVKGVSIALAKRKGGCTATCGEKLMADT